MPQRNSGRADYRIFSTGWAFATTLDVRLRLHRRRKRRVVSLIWEGVPTAWKAVAPKARTAIRATATIGASQMTATTASSYREGAMTSEQRMVIFASSLGTVFEWYDFYIYGTLGAFLAKYFFSNVPPNVGFIFALLAFAAGFAVRPFGALIFGRTAKPAAK